MILQALEYESGKSQSLSFLKSRVLVITLTIHPKKSESTFDHCGRTRESARRVFHINSRYRTHLISSFRFTVLDLKPKSSGDLIKIPLLLLLQMQASFKPKLGRAGLLRSTPGEDPKWQTDRDSNPVAIVASISHRPQLSTLGIFRANFKTKADALLNQKVQAFLVKFSILLCNEHKHLVFNFPFSCLLTSTRLLIHSCCWEKWIRVFFIKTLVRGS